jgi:co-chaperonin GroES (HSP10)
MNSQIEEIAKIVDPLNQQVVILKDESESRTETGLYIGEGAKAKFKSGVIVALADDCKNTALASGVRVGYQRHAGADMSIVTKSGSHNIVVMNEGSLTMVIKTEAKLEGGE